MILYEECNCRYMYYMYIYIYVCVPVIIIEKKTIMKSVLNIFEILN